MADLSAPLLTASIALPLAAAALASIIEPVSHARGTAIASLSATVLLLGEVLREVLGAGGGRLVEAWPHPSVWLAADSLNAAPLLLFAAVALVTLVSAPKRDVTRSFLVTLLTLVSSVLAAYASANLAVFLAGWTISLLPFLFRRQGETIGLFPRIVLGVSALSLTVAVVLMAGEGFSLSGPHNSPGGIAAFAFLIGAALLRERIFPFHRATIALFSGKPILLGALLVNSHLGVFLIARVAMPLFPQAADGALPWLGGLALVTALYTAVLGIAEREPRRLLALLMVSQSSAILAGLTTASHEGVAGALVQWMVLAVASTMLLVIYRSVEARIDHPLDGPGFLGLAASMPRLAVFFAISGFTVVGLPGTLGFAGEDLLLHGVLAGYSWWGAALPIAIALNAYHAFRLFARLFLGRDEVTGNTALDALPRERWALAACLAFLVWGGLAPHKAVLLQTHAAGSLARHAEAAPVPRP